MDSSEKYKIIHWHSANCGNRNSLKNKDRFNCIPIGFSQWVVPRQGFYPLLKIQEYGDKRVGIIYDNGEFKHSGIAEKKKMFLCNYGTLYLKHRREIMDFFKQNMTNETLFRKSWGGKDYYNNLMRSFFVVSPEGAGLDCYRSYESILFGSVPIMRKTGIEEIFEELPVHYVDSYEEVRNLTFMREKFQEIYSKEKKYKLEKLFMNYWQKKIYEGRPEQLKTCFFQYENKKQVEN